MKFLIFSDIHSNLDAFQAVLKDIDKTNVDKRIFLGDIVGYGAEPNECVELLKETADCMLAGNHDYAAVEKTDISYFNQYAKEAILWTREVLTEENKEYLKNLPVMKKMDLMTFAHSTPKEPDKWHYIMNIQSAVENFDYFDTRLCFIGHSHHPIIIERDTEGNITGRKRNAMLLNESSRYIINDGSVGQPRDGNPDASYCIFDTDEQQIEIKRVTYNIKSQQKKMRQKGLPDFLIDRIAYGR